MKKHQSLKWLLFIGMLLLLMTGCRKKGTDNEKETTNSISSINTSSAQESSNTDTSSDTSETKPEPEEETIADYFIDTNNKMYKYYGEGIEYAGFTEYTDYSEKNRKQVRQINPGTTVAEVVELQKDQIVILFHEGEHYFRENLLNKSNDVKEVLIKAPLETGNSWTIPDGRTKTITGVKVPVTTRYGDFEALEITTKFKAGEASQKDYYAPSVGLVKSIYEDENEGEKFEVLTELERIEEGPFYYTIQFYYPNFDKDRIEYVQKEVQMTTNEETKKALEKAYREVPDGLAEVLPEGAEIRSLYLNQDGKAYVDFSKELIENMNAGSGLESMILQSIVDTVGNYYGVRDVYLTVEEKPYESGHISKAKGEFWEVDLEGIPEFK